MEGVGVEKERERERDDCFPHAVSKPTAPEAFPCRTAFKGYREFRQHQGECSDDIKCREREFKKAPLP